MIANAPWVHFQKFLKKVMLLVFFYVFVAFLDSFPITDLSSGFLFLTERIILSTDICFHVFLKYHKSVLACKMASLFLLFVRLLNHIIRYFIAVWAWLDRWNSYIRFIKYKIRCSSLKSQAKKAGFPKLNFNYYCKKISIKYLMPNLFRKSDEIQKPNKVV